MSKDIYKQIDEVQTWLRENQARGNDDVFMAKVKEMRALMDDAYTCYGLTNLGFKRAVNN